MSSLAKLRGVDPEVYNQWQLHWLADDLVLILTVLGIVIPVALWFFWTSLNRIGSRSKKLLLVCNGFAWLRDASTGSA